MISLKDILAAHGRIASFVYPTPLVRSDYLSDLTGGRVFLKPESQQLLNAFKIRGMINRALTMMPVERRAPLLVVSSGNHAVAASYAGRRWGLDVTVLVPENTAQTKISKIRRYGARIVQKGSDYDEANSGAEELLASRPGMLMVDPTSDRAVVAGYGTIGVEIARDLPSVDEVLVPVGGGGLITGVGLALKGMLGGVRVRGVQTSACPAMLVSLKEGVIHRRYPSGPSFCEAVIGGVGDLPFEMAHRSLDEISTAPERAVARAVRLLLEHDKLVVEPSAALGVAHILENPQAYRGRETVVLISGGNVDYPLLRRLLDPGGEADGG